jgi:hypothetical protein
MCELYTRVLCHARNANIVRIVDDDVIVMSYVCVLSLGWPVQT